MALNTCPPSEDTMRAVFWEGKVHSVSVKEVPMPKLLAPEDAIVEITTSAVCGSDLHTYRGVFGSRTVPYQLGHEAIGIVREVGAAVNTFKPGDRVIVVAFLGDGNIQTHPHLDIKVRTLGFGSQFGLKSGLQAEYVRVPFADSTLFKVPHKLPDKEWLFLGDIWATAWFGLDSAGFQSGESVAIFGAGPVGLLCAYSAILRGAATVFVVDHIAERLAKATSIGAVPINFTRGGEASEQILALKPGGVERTVDCVGEECINSELEPQQDYVVNEAVKITSNGGGVGLIGVYLAVPDSKGAPRGSTVKPGINFPISDFWYKGLTLRGGIVDPTVYASRLIELVDSGRARPGFVVTGEYDIGDAEKAYRRFNKHLEIKVLLTMGAKFPMVENRNEDEIEDGLV